MEYEISILLKGTKIIYTIFIKKDKEILYGPIYSLIINKLKALRDYFKINLAKGRIYCSESLVNIFILFIKKKDSNLRLYVDYCGLNKIIIKNRHLLFLIGETLDRLSEI